MAGLKQELEEETKGAELMIFASSSVDRARESVKYGRTH